MPISLTLPNIEERFLPPPNWKIKSFYNPDTGHDIYYRTAIIKNAKATLICLPGLSEFGEKYIETARFFNAQGYNFITLDWAYQGFSTRFKRNRHKRHSDNYETDLLDLDCLIRNHIDHSHPLYMLAHSMGGHIGLRYIADHPHIFKAASFSAPMLNIRVLKYVPKIAQCTLSPLKRIHDKYVIGGGNWNKDKRSLLRKSIFSHDAYRDKVHNAWCLSNPKLQIGSTTYKWICESIKSIRILKDKQTLQKINCPVLLAIAGKEKLVDNAATKKAAQIMTHARLLNLKNSKHEILMETDNIRDEFLNETTVLFNQ